MSLGKKPTVFISSTCYDLKQIRVNLREFFSDELGYDVLVSEHDSFPLDPQLSAVENCLRVVDERADVFVLIIGYRYGWVAPSGRSVTNMEFLRALAKRIPIYVFIERDVLSKLQVWKENPGVTFASIDDPKLFEFVDSIRSGLNLWTFSYETSQEIIPCLKTQLGYLFNDSLALRLRTTPDIMTGKVRQLHGEAFKVALLRPDFWEYKLFTHVLSDGLKCLEDKRRDFDYGISLAEAVQIHSLEELLDYIPTKTSQLLRASDALASIFHQVLRDAIDAETDLSDIDKIIYAANRIVDIYSLIIDWSLSFRAIVAVDEASDLIDSFAQMCRITLDQIEDFSRECNEKLLALPDDYNPTEKLEPVNVSLNLTAPNMEAFYSAMRTLRQKHGFPEEEAN